MNERASPVRRPDELPDWPRQPLRGLLLEGYRYTSREFATREWEQMWTKVWLLLGREHYVAAGLLIGGVGATDWVDGYLARRLGQVSELGKDPRVYSPNPETNKL